MPDLAAETDAEAVILFGSRGRGGWDRQSDLDAIVIHEGAGDDDARAGVYGMLDEIKERHYPGYREYESLHHGVKDGQIVETPAEYITGRRTLNHVMARAARERRIFSRDPSASDRFRHDGDVSKPAGDAQFRAARRPPPAAPRVAARRCRPIEHGVAQLLSDPTQAALAARQTGEGRIDKHGKANNGAFSHDEYKDDLSVEIDGPGSRL